MAQAMAVAQMAMAWLFFSSGYSETSIACETGRRIAFPTPARLIETINPKLSVLHPPKIIPAPEKVSPIRKTFFRPKMSARRPLVTRRAQLIIPKAIIIHCNRSVATPKSLWITGRAVLTMVNTKAMTMHPELIPSRLSNFISIILHKIFFFEEVKFVEILRNFI